MSEQNLTYDDLRRIVELIKSSQQFSEFRLKVGEIELELRRRRDEAPAAASTAAAALALDSSPPPTPLAQPVVPRSAAGSEGTWPEGSTVIRSPMVGTFYRAPEPRAPPFVEVGQQVEPATTICIIEVMKLMTSVAAGVHGVVAQVLVDDAAAVEIGQPLILLRPQ